MKRRAKRYQVTQTERGCELYLTEDYTESGLPETHEFWCPSGGGYVYEEFSGRPAVWGRQLGASLFGGGSCATVGSRDALPRLISRMARAHCDAFDRGDF